MAKSILHARLPLRWPVSEPTPFSPGSGGFRALRAAVQGAASADLVPRGPLDPVAIPHLPYITARGRLLLLDRLFATTSPGDTLVIDRFIDAYLLLATQGFVQVPGFSTRRRALAKTTLRAVELMNRLFQDTWQQQMAAPSGWWRRFLETYRAAGEARLFTIRRPLFRTRGESTVQHAAAVTLLHAAANPFAWEAELYPHLQRLLRLLSEDVLLFPAASPSAYAEGRPGRFVFDAATDRPPAPPEGWEHGAGGNQRAQWWILDTSRVLTRLADFRRNLALGASAERVHRVLTEIPEPSRGILLRRLERILARPGRRQRPSSGGQAHLVTGLEQAVRHGFARRWSQTRDLSTLDTNVRLQSEVGTRARDQSALHRWQVLDRHDAGIRLEGPHPGGQPLTGRVAGVLETSPDGWPGDASFRAGIVRWQRVDPEQPRTELGLELLPGPPEDCWCRMMRGPGSTLHEYPALLLPSHGQQGPSLLMPAGLYQAGGLVTLRTDDRDHPAELLQVLEMGVHFEHVEIRLDQRR